MVHVSICKAPTHASVVQDTQDQTVTVYVMIIRVAIMAPVLCVGEEFATVLDWCSCAIASITTTAHSVLTVCMRTLEYISMEIQINLYTMTRVILFDTHSNIAQMLCLQSVSKIILQLLNLSSKPSIAGYFISLKSRSFASSYTAMVAYYDRLTLVKCCKLWLSW